MIPQDPSLPFLSTEVPAGHGCAQLVRCVLGLEPRASHLCDSCSFCQTISGPQQAVFSGWTFQETLGLCQLPTGSNGCSKTMAPDFLMSSILKGGIFDPTFRVQVDWQLHWLTEKQKQGWDVKGRDFRRNTHSGTLGYLLRSAHVLRQP